MPPKKEVKVEKKVLWGRPGNTLKMGIVGLPNVGKSTTFNLLAKMSVPAENFPFCTIDPNLAKVSVPDERFEYLVKYWKPGKNFPATLSILDIAGLVRGASKGEGLGNAFLSHIREVDGIYHVVRAFEDPEITHVEIDIDPIRDLEIIATELVLKDLKYCEDRLEDLAKIVSRSNDKASKEEKELLEKVKSVLDKNMWIRQAEWTPKEIEAINPHLFLTTKSVVYLINLSENDFRRKKNKWLGKIAEWVKNNINGPIIPYSADFESKLFEKQQSGKEDPKEEMKEDEIKKEGAPVTDESITMIDRIVKTGYKALDLIYYFTMGADEVKCWTVREGTRAPQAAGVIHTDFEKGFICAEVQKYDDFHRLGSELAVKNEGKLRQQGKEYVVEDGDVMFFKFNAPSGKK